MEKTTENKCGLSQTSLGDGIQGYVPLDVQSSYSIGRSICAIPKIVDKARSMRLPAIALADEGVMFGAVKFYMRCVRNWGSDADTPQIKPILGITLDVFGDGAFHTLRLIAKNADGYRNLILVSSERAMPCESVEHPVDFKTIEKWRDGLICLTEETDPALVERCIAVFGDDFVFEATSDDCDFSAWPSVMVCAANPVRQIDKDDTNAQEIWKAIRAGKGRQSPTRRKCHAPRHLLSPDEMAGLFPSHPDWIANTLRLAERVEPFSIHVGRDTLAFPVPDGFAGRLEWLRHLAFEGAKSRWGDPLPEKVCERLEYELSVIAGRKSFDAVSYLLVVRDIIETARRIGVFVGPGRGSASGSAIAYSLGITDVDPLKHGLLFERFLNPDTDTAPDIDIDFDEEGRYEVLRHLVKAYGEDHVAHVATFSELSPQNAIREVAKDIGVPEDVIDALARLAPAYLRRQTFDQALRDSERLRRFYDRRDGAESWILHLAEKLCGCVQHVGVHACGFVISAQSLKDRIPLMHADDETVPFVSQCDGWDVEDVGLVKFDFLGLKELSKQRRLVKLILAKTGEDIDLSRIPEDDERTLAVFAHGQTEGIFQFESEGVRKVLLQLKPTRFSDIVACYAMFRPGIMEYLQQFILRKKGKGPYVCEHPLMEDCLAETYGMTIYQEQVMRLARKLAGFTRGESDSLRKALGKKQQDRIDVFQEKFELGCLANPDFRIGKWRDEDQAKELAAQIFNDLEHISLYAFMKTHAVCYTLVAYRSAYLKAHWPKEYGIVAEDMGIES